MLNPNDGTQSNNSNTSTLQPMRFSDILDTTFSLYRKHFLLFLGISTFYFFGSLVTYSLEGFFEGSDLKNFVPNLVSIPFSLVSIGGIIIATATTYLGGHITSADALQQALRRFWHVLVGYFLWVIVLVIPLIVTSLFLIFFITRGTSSVSVLFIPFAFAPFSLYFGVRWGFVAAAVLLEKTGVQNAFKRSSELVRGTWWRVFGMLVLILLLSAAIHYILEISLGSIFILLRMVGETDLKELIQWSVMETDLGSSNLLFYAIMTCTDLVLKTFTAPIWVIGITLLYFDLRIRKEGFDIEIQANTATTMLT